MNPGHIEFLHISRIFIFLLLCTVQHAWDFKEHLGDGVLALDFEKQLGSIAKDDKIGWQGVKKGSQEAVSYI